VRGEAEPAVEHLELAVAALEDGGVGNPNQFRVHPDLVEAYVRLGRLKEAEPIAATLARHAEQTAIHWTMAASRRCYGLIATDGDAAAEAFSESLQLDDGASDFERARTELCFGERLRRDGHRREARDHLRTALAAFEANGAWPWAERVRSELRASGLVLREREPAAQERLTPQEIQVARLVAEGKTNREVAATLFLSPKTVEFHLTHIYRKLRIRSRAELVRQIADGDRTDKTPLTLPEGTAGTRA
jgi:DNA-binding CsgD family transcriptional regulator